MTSAEDEQDEFERAFQEWTAAPIKKAGRPKAPYQRDMAIYSAVRTAYKRGHPLSPPTGISRCPRRPSSLRHPGAATGKRSAFEVVAEQMKVYSASAELRQWCVDVKAVMSVYYAVAKRRAVVDSIASSADFEFVFTAPLWAVDKNKKARWKARLAAHKIANHST